ncbi:MAG: phosphonate ABC transporter ATP-binding protein [Pseudomonadota bacterium]
MIRFPGGRCVSLKIERLNKSFGDNHVIRNLSIEIDEGEMVGVIGRSGAGKSTLLRLINLMEKPDSGIISWRGDSVAVFRGNALREWRARCAMIFQDYGIVDRLDVITNVLVGRLSSTGFWRSLIKFFKEADRADAITELHNLGLSQAALQRASTLSGGEKQRVAIARAMMQRPHILLADEPVSSLDPANSASVMEALKRINRDRAMTVLMNIHDVEIAKTYCDRIIGLAGGEVVFDGPPRQLTEECRAQIYGKPKPHRSAA